MDRELILEAGYREDLSSKKVIEKQRPEGCERNSHEDNQRKSIRGRGTSLSRGPAARRLVACCRNRGRFVHRAQRTQARGSVRDGESERCHGARSHDTFRSRENFWIFLSAGMLVKDLWVQGVGETWTDKF